MNACAVCWCSQVYDFSCFFEDPPCYKHPGGNEVILKLAGKDATEGFIDAGHKPGIAQRKKLGHIVIGTVPSRGASLLPKAKSRGVESTDAYGGGTGGWRERIGRSTWHYLHSAAAKYPGEHLSNKFRVAALRFFPNSQHSVPWWFAGAMQILLRRKICRRRFEVLSSRSGSCTRVRPAGKRSGRN